MRLHSFFVCLISLGLLASAASAQEESSDPLTNTGEVFQDPFSETPMEEVPPPPAPSASPEIAPQSSASSPSPAASPETNTELNPLSAPNSSPASSPRVIEFPEPEEVGGPKAQDYFEAEALGQRNRVGTWNLGGAFGMGYRINKVPNQVHMELNGGYRIEKDWELGGVVSYRFVSQWFLSFLVMAKYIWTLSKSQNFQIDWAPSFGTGWTHFSLNAKEFTRVRWAWRINSDFLFYASPQFALVGLVGLETYILDYISGEGFSNPGRGGGWPTAGLFGLGVRFEF